MSHILIISHDVIGERMAGVGIRYYEIARALSKTHHVTLAVPGQSTASVPGVELLHYHPDQMASLGSAISCADCILCYPGSLCNIYSVLPPHMPVIVDGYDLDILEQLVIQAHQQTFDVDTWHTNTNALVLNRGDFFICATQRQRDWWLGCLDAAGRINLRNYERDPSLRRLVDIVPYGIPHDPPRHTRWLIRGVLPGITSEDIVVLWGGGMWDWFDPYTLLQAAILLRDSHPEIKFVFPGTRHPASHGSNEPNSLSQFRQMASQHGLLNSSIFLGDWVPYEDWQNYLLESTIGISLHHDHIEAHFSARTRITSYIWAGLPMVLTEGDELAALATQHNVAQLVPHEGTRQVAQAILIANGQRYSTHFTARFNELRARFDWQRCIAPIDQFAQRPVRAADKMREA